MSLPEGWESDYDGTRWLFRYKATGTVQYHFPQPGDEYAEFLLDAGTGPIQLSPEERLVIEQQAKRQSISGWDNGARNGVATSGSKRERKRVEDVEDEFGMSATGYFDPTYFPGAFNSISPLGEDDPEETAELPGSSQQIRSPVGFVAELATQDTVKCAEELAPVELDGTTIIPAPIQTNAGQELAELPTHQSPVEEKTPDPHPTQSTTQLVDPSSLTSASFSYSELKPNARPNNSVPPRASSIRRKPVLSSTGSTSPQQNKYQPWKPTQGIAEHPSQGRSEAIEALPQTSVLQNQNSELGIIGRKDSESESLAPGCIPNSLITPSAPNKPAPIVSSISNGEVSPVPTVLQPAHGSTQELVLPVNTSTQFVPGMQPNSNVVGSAADHVLPHTPSVLKPGGLQASNQNDNLGRVSGKPGPIPALSSNASIKESTLPHPQSEHTVQIPSSHCDQPNANTFSTISNHGGHIHAEVSSNPSKPTNPISSGPSRIDSQPHINVDGQPPVVAPLNFVKRHSSKSSQVSSIAELQDSNLASVPSDDISEVISMISSLTPQPTPAPGNNNKPVPSVANEGADIPSTVPQTVNEQSPLAAIHIHQSNELTCPATANPSQPASVNATAVTQNIVVSSSSNVGSEITQSEQKIQTAQYPHPPLSGSLIQNQSFGLPSPPHVGTPGTSSIPLGPLGPQGSVPKPFLPQTLTTPIPSPPPSQANDVSHMNQSYQTGAPSNYANNIAPRPPQVQHAGISGSSTNGAVQIPAGHNNSFPSSMAGPSITGHSQNAPQKPTLHQQVLSGSLSHEFADRPPLGYQAPSTTAAQMSSQSPYQQPSPVTHAVSPVQSQVSSPAQSIASLHISQSSTPSTTLATMNNTQNSHTGPNITINQTTSNPIRPSSVPAHLPTQQVGNPVPTSVAGIPSAQTSTAASPPAKPYPMLPGQVTPLPSQIGSAPIQPFVQQPVNNSYAKPAFNTQQAIVGQQPAQPAQPGAPAGHSTLPAQMNVMTNSSQGHVTHGPASSQVHVQPPQQQSHPGTGGHQSSPPNQQQQPPQMASHPTSVASHQVYTPQAPMPTLTGSPQVVGGQNTFPPPPIASVTLPQGKPPSSSQTGAALSEAGKGMKKWAKKMFQSPALKQTGVAIGGAILAESVGVNAGAGAQLANNIYTNATRPPLTHAQTAPPQTHGVPGAITQAQLAQIGQQPPGKLQPQPLQQHQYLHQPQAGQPKPPQPGHPNQPQLGHPQHLGHPHPPQPGQIKPTLPSHPQSGHPHLGQSQPGHAQPLQQPAGIQTLGRPPIVQIQNPALQAGIAVNLNAQAQAQASFYQQPQYPPVNPVMVNGVRPVASSSNDHMSIDPMTATAVATLVGTAVGTALRPDHPQPQTAHGNTQSYAHQDHASQPGPSSAAHSAETHEQAYHSTAPAPAPASYADNSYLAETAYTDNSAYSANNTYVDNTEVNNTIVIDNSTTIVADTTYNNANYSDMTSFSNTDITTSTALGYDVNSAVYTDNSTTAFSVDESFTIAATSDVAVTSVDYSGDSWGDFFS
ncbi:hypothetical protein F5B22DRAFT_642462 [Xylaria bambusicola]|uniref:uncharacterized protein n=1 Tax=Xylaria bambusicola TaxID=326684 RepID=UPI002007F451|nr:uncharacterized protein F5B22DRAFT_642462 [Xylaria bambusicola]KAI0525443.1 hypothetical protein F5B22DRAFT_642462 [Xylaria bambusicola]